MPNVDSTGKLGRSMDYSMYLKHKRHDLLTSGYTLKSATGNPMFGRDKKTRGFDNGIVTVLFEKGLTVSTRSGRPFSGTYTISFTGGNYASYSLAVVASGLTLEFIQYDGLYFNATSNYPRTPINPTILSYIQSVSPFTTTLYNNTTQNSSTYTLVGDPATDKATIESTSFVTVNDGDSATMTITFG